MRIGDESWATRSSFDATNASLATGRASQVPVRIFATMKLNAVATHLGKELGGDQGPRPTRARGSGAFEEPESHDHGDQPDAHPMGTRHKRGLRARSDARSARECSCRDGRDLVRAVGHRTECAKFGRVLKDLQLTRLGYGASGLILLSMTSLRRPARCRGDRDREQSRGDHET